MNNTTILRLCATSIVALALPAMVGAETVGVFFDPAVAQINFAVGDVKAALEKNKFTVELLPVASLSASDANKKVVIVQASNAAVTTLLAAQGAGKGTGLGEQAYGLRTTEGPQKSYWVLGGDANGAMYGGLQLAENIAFDGFMGTYDETVSPDFLQRGIKLNLPMDIEPDWHYADALQLKDYKDLGGVGIPSCETKTSK